jgi:hypothetical protein
VPTGLTPIPRACPEPVERAHVEVLIPAKNLPIRDTKPPIPRHIQANNLANQARHSSQTHFLLLDRSSSLYFLLLYSSTVSPEGRGGWIGHFGTTWDIEPSGHRIFYRKERKGRKEELPAQILNRNRGYTLMNAVKKRRREQEITEEPEQAKNGHPLLPPLPPVQVFASGSRRLAPAR